MDFLLDVSLWRFIAALAGVLAAAWGLIFLIKKLKVFPSPKTEGKYLHFLDMLPLDTQRRLVLVSYQQQTVLILLSPKGDTMVSLPAPRSTEP